MFENLSQKQKLELIIFHREGADKVLADSRTATLKLAESCAASLPEEKDPRAERLEKLRASLSSAVICSERLDGNSARHAQSTNNRLSRFFHDRRFILLKGLRAETKIALGAAKELLVHLDNVSNYGASKGPVCSSKVTATLGRELE